VPPLADTLTLPDAPPADRRIGPHGQGLAIAAEQLVEFGGVERIVATLMSRYPAATLLATRFRSVTGFPHSDFEARLAEHASVWNGELDGAPPPSGIQLLGPSGRSRRHYLFPLYARRMRGARLDGVRVVLATGGMGWSNGVHVPAGVRHVCYSGGAPRPLYERTHEYLAEYPPHVRPLVRASLPALRYSHRRLLAAPDALATNSHASAAALERVVRRRPQVIYPPVRTEFFTPARRDRRHYLVVSRLRAHKRIDVVIEAFARLGLPLVIAGDGPWRERFERALPTNIRLVGHVGDSELRELYRSSRALVSASVEEFGLCLAEALACGIPVIAPRDGGSGEIVADGVNGVALPSADPGSVVRAVERLEREPADPAACRASAERFSEARFVAQIESLIQG
jgi:glycosyltransferase involved in cell wall biosynthesis